jgi:glutaconyl-CoA/methylmalonyl-CoA decarboxylase subunit gamma
MKYGQVFAPCLGTAAMCLAEDGAHVSAGDLVMQIEAMKMYFDAIAPASGIIHWQVKLGELVEENQILAYIVLD